MAHKNHYPFLDKNISGKKELFVILFVDHHYHFACSNLNMYIELFLEFNSLMFLKIVYISYIFRKL